ncbi:hypothetical protein T03_1607 [Trichinella britovi]|uniref:Uncharacterized protein n=1 Tax=Trichinella britovi TaxID=45882 RepID=A0A0V1CWU1_TRIBR|nr:hypothetical protein T03_1607 [Trichinella britovi]
MLPISLIFSGVEQGSIVGEPTRLTSGEEGFYFEKYQFFEAHTETAKRKASFKKHVAAYRCNSECNLKKRNESFNIKMAKNVDPKFTVKICQHLFALYDWQPLISTKTATAATSKTTTTTTTTTATTILLQAIFRDLTRHIVDG